MKVILLEKIPHLGVLGDVANVRPGYARNYLFPQGKAERATPAAITDFETRRGDLEKQEAGRQSAIANARDSLDGYILQIPARASPDGSLYGSITTTGIAAALNEQKIAGVDIRRGQISLASGNLKEIGDHEVSIVLEQGMEAKITVSVLAEESESEARTAPEKSAAADENAKNKEGA